MQYLKTIRVACCITLWLPIATFSLHAQQAMIHPPDTPIPPTFFGLHIHHATNTTAWPTVPFGSWRLWDTYSDWAHLEPERGKWNFSNTDKQVTLAEQHGIDVIFPLAFSPTWASSRANEKSAAGIPGAAAPPKDLDDWRNYVRTVATRYKGRVRIYEIWNEPNLPSFFSGTPDEMVTLAREASKILKEIDPAIIVVSPSATTSSGVPWLRAFLQKDGGNYVDVIGFHLYVAPGPPESLVPLISQVRTVMSESGIARKPLWDTEAGWEIANQGPGKKAGERGLYGRVLSEDEASGYLARSYIIQWAKGVERFYWYSWDNGRTGLIEVDRGTLKATAKAYGEVERWLIGARMAVCDPDRGTWVCLLVRDGGYTGRIVWNPDRGGYFPIPPGWGVKRARDLAGGAQNLSGAKTVEIGPKPILLENQTR